MIFFTLGTERHPFGRLIEAAESIARVLPEEGVFVQLGHHPREPRGCAFERWLPFPELAQRVASARVVVAHAGAGTILTCQQHGRIPVVLARQRALGEHQDDHQLQLARRMDERARILLSLVDLRVKYREGEDRDVLALLLSEIRRRGWPVLDTFLSRSPKAEGLATNPTGRPLSILHAAPQTLVDRQMAQLAHDLLAIVGPASAEAAAPVRTRVMDRVERTRRWLLGRSAS